MAHVAAEGFEVAAAVAELADVAMTAFERRKSSERERQQELEAAEQALSKERSENEKLQQTLDMYRHALKSFKDQGLLQHMEQLNGMGPEELCDKLKERVDSPQFLHKLGSSSEHWEVLDEKEDDSAEDFVVISQDDIVDSIASYMAKYLASQPNAKNMTPEEMQKALSKAFTVNERVGFFKRAWSTGKVLYTVVSWTTAAVGIYKNPLVIRAALTVMWTTISVLLRLVK